jgi:hypothetical protein
VSDDNIYDDGWVCGRRLDDEDPYYSEVYETREEAIKGAAHYLGVPIGDAFQTAKMHHVRETMPCPFDAEHAIDRIENDEWFHELTEKWTDEVMTNKVAMNELQASLEAMWDAWVKKHDLYVTVVRFDDLEHHIVEDDTTVGEEE